MSIWGPRNWWRGQSRPNGLEACRFKAGSLSHKGTSSRERVSDRGRRSCRASSRSAPRGLIGFKCPSEESVLWCDCRFNLYALGSHEMCVLKDMLPGKLFLLLLPLTYLGGTHLCVLSC